MSRLRSIAFASALGAVAVAAGSDEARAALAPAVRIGDFGVAAQGAAAPILPPGAPTVLICGKPAARVGDALSFIINVPTPIALASTIALGSSSVFVAGKPAARLGDPLSSGGTISGPGCASVLIGP